MQDTKPWYSSRTILGSLIAVAAALAGVVGISIDQDTQSMMVDAILQIVTVGGSILAIFGRLSADKRIV